MPIRSNLFPIPSQSYHPEVNVIKLMEVLIAQNGAVEPIRNEMIRQLELQHFNLRLDLTIDNGRTPELADQVANKQSVIKQHISELETL